jgi:hypothetical protein
MLQALRDPLRVFTDFAVQQPSYIIFTDGARYYAKNGKTGVVEFINIDAGTLIQNVINVLPPAGGKIAFRSGVYRVKFTTAKPIILLGEGENTIIELQGPESIVNNGPLLELRDMKIVTNVNGSYQIHSMGGKLVFRDVVFDLPVGTIDRCIIYADAGEAHIHDSRLVRGGSDTVDAFVFFGCYSPAGHTCHVVVRNLVVDDIRVNPAGNWRPELILGYSGEINGLTVKNVVGRTTPGVGGYLSIGIERLENVEILGGSITFFDVADFCYVRNFKAYIWTRIGVPRCTANFVDKVEFHAGGGFDFGQPRAGEVRRAQLNNIYLKGSTIYFGGVQEVEINNLVCEGVPGCVQVVDEIDSGNPVHITLNNVILRAMGEFDVQALLSVYFPSTNIRNVVINNVILEALYNPAKQYSLVVLGTGGSNNPKSDVTNISINNLLTYTTVPRGKGGPYIWFTYPEGRRYETQVIRVANSLIYTEDVLPFGRWSHLNTWGLRFGRYDRVINTRILHSYNWAPYNAEYVKGDRTVAVGTGDAYGTPTVVESPGGTIKDFDVILTWSGTFATGEVVTVKVESEDEDGVLASVEKTSTTPTTITLTLTDKLALLTGKPISRLRIYAKTNQATTTVTVTASVYGRG